MVAPDGVSVFFDAGCGPCTFWARVTRALARSPVSVHPLDGREAERRLRDLAPDQRFGYAHVVEEGRVWTGADLMPAWVGILAGPTARRITERAPPIRWALRATYQRFWTYRRRKGCSTVLSPLV